LQEYLSSVPNSQPFIGLETEYLQTKYFKEHFQLLVTKCSIVCQHFTYNFQEPVERLLGKESLPDSDGIQHDYHHYCYDIPLLTSLQLLLKNKEVQAQVK